MKFTPLRLIVFSSSDCIPSVIDGACSSSSSVKIHCCSASTTAGGGGLGGSRRGSCVGVLVVETITNLLVSGEAWSDGEVSRCTIGWCVNYPKVVSQRGVQMRRRDGVFRMYLWAALWQQKGDRSEESLSGLEQRWGYCSSNAET